MSIQSFQLPVQSNPLTDFTEGLAINEASATVNLVLPTRDPLWFVQAISILSVQNLGWELQAYTSAVNLGGTLQTDRFNALWQFNVMQAGPPASPGYPMQAFDVSPSPGWYRFYIEGNYWPIWDLDMLTAKNAANVGGTYPNNSRLHLRLINRSATAKLAGPSGAVLVTLYCSAQGRQV